VGDLWLGGAIIWLLAGGLFALALVVCRKVPRRWGAVVGLPGLGLVLLHAFVLSDRAELAWLLPFSNLVVVGNWAPLGVGFLAGVVWRCGPRPRWRRGLAIVLLVGACVWHSYGWLFEQRPRCSNVWRGEVCMQTTRASCSAAAAATLLRAHGIAATEDEMARLCLTRSWGTTRLGLYRGLKLKTAGTPWDVEVFSWTLDELRAKPPGPVLLHVGLARGADADPRYQRDWGWDPGREHAVLLYGFLPHDLADMVDPSIGREKWRAEGLLVLWRGQGMRLVRR
jgi:hypothetical protein